MKVQVAPTAPGPFGRTHEIEELASVLEDGSCRLLTLWGPAGIGKTTLARALLERTSHERLFMDLRQARSEIDVVLALLDALGVDAMGVDAGTSAPRAGRALAAAGDALLVLDEAEHALDHVRRLVLLWRSLAPRARFVLTSRIPLSVAAEVLFEVGPLALPGAGEDVRSSDAVRLLLARARALRPGLDGDDAVLARIVRHLDGIPLAIELAATRLVALSPGELEAELARGSHAVLAGALVRSWDALEPARRNVLAFASVFRGGFDLPAARAVCGATEADLVALRRSSLLQSAPSQDRPRFDLLTPVRDFAEERLGSRLREAWTAHARHFVAQGSTADAENLRAIVGRDVDRALRLAALVALEPILIARGDAQSLVKLASDLEDEPRAREVRASARFALGELSLALEEARSDDLRGPILQALGRDEEAREAALRARSAADREGRGADAGRAVALLGLLAHVRGELDEARTHYADALAAHHAAGDGSAEIRTRLRMAFLEIDGGRAAEAARQLAALEAMPLGPVQQGLRLGYLGNAHRQLGDAREARALYDRAIALLERADERRLEATFRMDRGVALLLERRFEEATDDLEMAARAAATVGDRRLLLLVLGYLVAAHARASHVDRAREALSRAHEIAAGDVPARHLLELHAAHLALPGEVDLARDALAIAGAQPPEHARLARALLAAAIEAVAPPDDALAIQGTRVRPPHGAWIDLSNRPTTLRILRALAARSPVTTAELAALGWPGERMLAAAAANRVRVAIATLRALGLRDRIRSTPAGYVLDARVIDQS